MTSKTYCYQFSEQKVFASDNAPISFQINENYAIVAMNNYTVGVYDISNSNFTLINLFPVCGFIIKMDYCVADDYIITLETKDNTDINSNLTNSVRTYHNWRNVGTQNKMRFRAALGGRVSNSSPSHLGNSDKSNTPTETSFLENIIDVLEFLHLNHPLNFSIFTNSDSKLPECSKSYNPISEIFSNIGISENTYVHLYRFCQPIRKSLSFYPGLSPKLSKVKSNDADVSTIENAFCFQHLYTVKFSFIVENICLLCRVLVASSKDKVQAIQILEEKQKSDMFSSKMEKENQNSVPQIEIDISKCWLTSVSNARKSAANKPKLRPKEILGPTQNLDTASITLLRYVDSKEMSFETLLFRKYMTSTSGSEIQKIHLVKVPYFEKLGLFIVMRHEIIHYLFCLKTNEVHKLADYDFGNESVLSMAFSDHVNLIHVAFSNGDLVTYNSRLCASDLFESNHISKKVSLTRLGKVTLMGLTDVKCSRTFVCALCKFNILEDNETENVIIVSPDSWNFYLFSEPHKLDLKKSIIAHASHKGNKKLLQMLLCSLLVFPSKDEVSNQVIEDIIICCLKSEAFYMEIVPNLLLLKDLTIVNALHIFQVLETKELYNDNLFQLYAKQKLIKADFNGLSEEHFRWIVIKILRCSVDLLFQVIISNKIEDFLKVDLFTIEGLQSITFESCFIKFLYYSAHTEYELAGQLLSGLDKKGVKKLFKSHPHLIYHNKHHTSFGWVLNLYSPEIYAQVVASCYVNKAKDSHEFTNLEIAKQVGQCSHVLVLEEILRKSFKSNGLIPNSTKYCKIKFLNKRREKFNFSSLVSQEGTKSLANSDSYKNYCNQLLLLYHEFSFNVIEFCPHKVNQLCRKIPPWLQSLRHHNILNQFYPFNGIDPFSIPHNTKDETCPSFCCQNYLIRLQCLMSWQECSQLAGINVIEASCESMSHPAWKSLNFLLQHVAAKERNIVEIINFISSSKKNNENNIVNLYFSTFGKEISNSEWKKLIQLRPGNIPLNKILKHASSFQNLDEFIQMILNLKDSKLIKEDEYIDWVERADKLHHRDILLDSFFGQIMKDFV